MTRVLTCPECGDIMKLRDSRFGKFYGCVRYPQCSGTHGAHPNSEPLGTPANAATKLARMKAHAAFDSLWHHEGMTRRQAYHWLRTAMKLTKRQAHIAKFDAAQCAELLRLLDARKATQPVAS